MPNCKQCQASFEITNSDLAFYDKVSPVFNGKKYLIPPPTLCPECRQQRRLSHRNEMKLFRRKCDLTGKSIISIYAPESPYVVYEKSAWWGDQWDALSYGKDFDFTRSFFDQFEELQNSVPRISLLQEHTMNSDFTHNVTNLKNCYLLFSSDFNRDCGYGTWVQRSANSFDNFLIDRCEWVYESIFSNNIYNSCFTNCSVQCRDSAFLYNCHNCLNCFMCWDLRNRQYCIYNEQYTKQEYEKKRGKYDLSSFKSLQSCKQQFMEMIKEAKHPAIHTHGRIIGSTGDYLIDTEKCINCYELRIAKDCKNTIGFETKDTHDCTYVNGDFAYESCECFPTPFHSAFNINCYTGSDLFYCDLCMNNCQNLLGCIGMKKARYCILNKQYSKEGYESIIQKIIEHMKITGEYGEFLPSTLSPFGYNISEAFQYFPLMKKEVLKRDWKWRDGKDEIPDVEKIIPADRLPDSIDDIPDDILNWAIKCEATGRPFKIVKQELSFYRKHKLPIPRFHPDERHRRRMALRNPRKLWTRECDKCGKEIQTTYAPDRPEKVYCEGCYLKEIY